MHSNHRGRASIHFQIVIAMRIVVVARNVILSTHEFYSTICRFAIPSREPNFVQFDMDNDSSLPYFQF